MNIKSYATNFKIFFIMLLPLLLILIHPAIATAFYLLPGLLCMVLFVRKIIQTSNNAKNVSINFSAQESSIEFNSSNHNHKIAISSLQKIELDKAKNGTIKHCSLYTEQDAYYIPASANEFQPTISSLLSTISNNKVSVVSRFKSIVQRNISLAIATPIVADFVIRKLNLLQAFPLIEQVIQALLFAIMGLFISITPIHKGVWSRKYDTYRIIILLSAVFMAILRLRSHI